MARRWSIDQVPQTVDQEAFQMTDVEANLLDFGESVNGRNGKK
jgi:hypothetical protein